jgi:HAD superfamily hydrolase (TIGR01490 family)
MKLSKKLALSKRKLNDLDNIEELSFFDLDHTLLSVNCSFQFGIYLYRKNFFSFKQLLYVLCCYGLHKMGLLSISQIQMRIFKSIFLGASQDQVEKYAFSFVDEFFDKIQYTPAVKRLKEAKVMGHYIIILSSSPDFLVRLLAQRFEVNAWQATCYEVDENRQFSKISHVFLSDDKAHYVENEGMSRGIAKQQMSAYSDSILDLSFLKATGKPVGVNPDRRLKAICKRNQWEIL